MSTEVFLMEKVANLGNEGDVVKVADGYARNYLLPRNLAAPVTEGTRRQLAKLQAEREEAQKAAAEAAQALSKQLEGVSVTLAMKTSDGERLYGSVRAAQVAAALAEQNFTIDEHQIELPEEVKELGVFEATINLDSAQSAVVKVWVVEE